MDEGDKKPRFYTASEIRVSETNGGFEERMVLNTDPMYIASASTQERVSLYDQLKENQKREEDELAARRKLMYGVRPMDDEEYKDYEQMEIARRFREKQNRERIGREAKTFQMMQEKAMIAEAEEQTRVDTLTFGARPKTNEKKQTSSHSGAPAVQVKLKPKKTSKKKKAEKPAALNLLSYGTEDSFSVFNKKQLQFILSSGMLLRGAPSFLIPRFDPPCL